MKLDPRTRELIAVGTAVGANCHPCLEYHVGKARELHLADDEIGDAIEVGKTVRKGAQGRLDKLANDLLAQAQNKSAAAGCGCGERSGLPD